MSATETTWEYCRVVAKGNQTDPEYQSFLVRRPFGGLPSSYEYYNANAISNLSDKWFSLPEEWVALAESANWSTK